MEITRQNELIGALDELKKETQKMQRKGLPFMMASVVVWSLILYIQMTVQDLNKREHRLRLILCHKHPCVEGIILEQVAKAILITGAYERIVFLKLFNLSRNRFAVRLGDPRHIEFIAERSDHRNVTASRERCRAADRMIRAIGNMRSHR